MNENVKSCESHYGSHNDNYLTKLFVLREYGERNRKRRGCVTGGEGIGRGIMYKLNHFGISPAGARTRDKIFQHDIVYHKHYKQSRKHIMPVFLYFLGIRRINPKAIQIIPSSPREV